MRRRAPHVASCRTRRLMRYTSPHAVHVASCRTRNLVRQMTPCGQHRGGDALEAGDVGARDVVARARRSRSEASKAALWMSPMISRELAARCRRSVQRWRDGVLAHLESRGRHAARVRGLPRREQHPGLLERRRRRREGRACWRPRPRRARRCRSAPARIGRAELVLRRGRAAPRRPGPPTRCRPRRSGRRDDGFAYSTMRRAFDLLELAQQVDVDAGVVDDVAGGVGRRHRHGTRAEWPSAIA